MSVVEWTDRYMVFTTERFVEVALESWSEWDLNPRPLNSVQMLYNRLRSHAMSSTCTHCYMIHMYIYIYIYIYIISHTYIYIYFFLEYVTKLIYEYHFTILLERRKKKTKKEKQNKETQSIVSFLQQFLSNVLTITCSYVYMY